MIFLSVPEVSKNAACGHFYRLYPSTIPLPLKMVSYYAVAVGYILKKYN
jgi:hypothetical protein